MGDFRKGVGKIGRAESVKWIPLGKFASQKAPCEVRLRRQADKCHIPPEKEFFPNMTSEWIDKKEMRKRDEEPEEDQLFF